MTDKRSLLGVRRTYFYRNGRRWFLGKMQLNRKSCHVPNSVRTCSGTSSVCTKFIISETLEMYTCL